MRKATKQGWTLLVLRESACVFNVNNHTGIQEEKYRGEGLRVAAKKVWKL